MPLDSAATARGTLVAHAATIDGTTYIFFANFTYLQADAVATPISQSGIGIAVPNRLGTRMPVLPILGNESVVQGSSADAEIRFQLPSLQQGRVTSVGVEETSG